MVIACPRCATRYRLDPSRLPAAGGMVRCGRCQERFGTGAVAPAAEPAARAAAAAAPTAPAAPGAERSVPAPQEDRATLQTIGCRRMTAPLPQATPAPAPPVAAAAMAAGGPPDGPYLLTGEDGAEVELDRATLRERIRRGEVREETLLRPPGAAEPLAAATLPELERYFRLLRQAEAGTRPPAAACAVHPASPPQYQCTVCNALYCAVCAPKKQFGSTAVPWCRRCEDRCVPFDGSRHVTPFWRRLPEIVGYPLRGWGPFMILCCAVLAALGSFLPGPGKVLYFFVLAYQLHILRESAEGNRQLPDWPDLTDVWSITARGVKALVVSLIAWAPLIAFNLLLVPHLAGLAGGELAAPSVEAASFEASEPVEGQVRVEEFLDENGEFDFEGYQAAQGEAPRDAGPLPAAGLRTLVRLGGLLLAGNLLIGAAVLLYFPMCLIIAAVFDTVLPALNPLLIARCIARIKGDYLLALLACGALAACGLAGQLGLAVIPVAGAILGSLLATYVGFVQMHILGWTAHQGRERLAWDLRG